MTILVTIAAVLAVSATLAAVVDDQAREHVTGFLVLPIAVVAVLLAFVGQWPRGPHRIRLVPDWATRSGRRAVVLLDTRNRTIVLLSRDRAEIAARRAERRRQRNARRRRG